MSDDAPTWWQSHDPLHFGYLESNFPCRAACPVGTNAGGYVSLVGQGKYAEAYELARAPNPFASVCGRVCAHPCEAACRRGQLDAPISIRALKRFVNERGGVESGRSFEEIAKLVERGRPKTDKPGNVGVIGAGPAGLSCAHDLALMGHKVVVYDAAPVAGGMMRMGIPEYRLPRSLIAREIEFIAWLGVDIRLGVEIGKTVTFEELAARHDALFLAAGCRKGRLLKIPGIDLAGVLTAVDFLAAVNLGTPLDVGQRVAVIGGGNVAFDAARTARRFGGTSEPDETHHNLAIDAATVARRTLKRDVTLLSLESKIELPADAEELHEGGEEGVRVLHRRGPKEIVGENGHVVALRTLDVTRVFDEQKRFAPLFADGTEKDVACDTVIVATGQLADLTFLGDAHGMKVSPRSTIEVDPITLATSRTGIYAGGDVAFGPRIVISAVADGRRAARAIDTFLTGRSDEPRVYSVKVFDTFGYTHPFAAGDYEKIQRRSLPVLPVQRRGGWLEVEGVLSEREAQTEGRRCLHCWVNTIFDSKAMNGAECVQCGGCVDVCPEQCIDLVSLRRVGPGDGFKLPDGTPVEVIGPAGAAMLKDESACIRCGLCARRCPVQLITMQAFYRESERHLVELAEKIL